MVMAVPSLGAMAASFTVLLRAACLEKLPRASPEFNLIVLTRDFGGPLVKVRVALQSREAANMLDLERLYRSHQVPTSYCTSDTTTTCDTGQGCIK